MKRAARSAACLVLAAAVAGGALAACGREGSDTATARRPAASGSAPTGGTDGGGPCTFSGSPDAGQDGADAPIRLLTDVRVGAHGCYERVTFELKPQAGETEGPVGWKVAYESGPITEDGSGRTVPVEGAAYLVVALTAAGADLSQEAAPPSYTGPSSIETAGTTRIRQVRRTGDFEGVVSWVIGLDRERPFRVTTHQKPMRVVVDVGDE